MSPMGVNIALVTGLAVAALWLGRLRKGGTALSLGLTVALVAAAAVRGVVVAADATTLPDSAGLEQELLRLVAWSVFAAGAAGSGWREPSRWAPLWLGAAMGELGGAVLAVSGVSDPDQRARRVMLATVGALLGRAGDPALFVLLQKPAFWMSSGVWMVLAAIVLAGVLLSAPRAVAGQAVHRPKVVVGLAVTAWGLAWVPEIGVYGVGGAGLALWVVCGARVPLLPIVRVGVLTVCGLVAVAAGATEAWAGLLESARIPYEAYLHELVWLSGALSGLVLGSDGGGLVGQAVLDRALALRSPTARVVWALGAAVAGLGPYLLTRTLGRALPRHLAWMGVSGAIVVGAIGLGVLGP